MRVDDADAGNVRPGALPYRGTTRLQAIRRMRSSIRSGRVREFGGAMTFLVNHQGTVFEKDLGPNSARIAAGTTSPDPDSSWRKVANAGLPQAGTR